MKSAIILYFSFEPILFVPLNLKFCNITNINININLKTKSLKLSNRYPYD